jgi:hypothetical protein
MAPSRIDVTKTLVNNTNAKWWKDPGMKKLNFMIVCVITAQMTCGYDEAVVGNFQAMKPWLKGMFPRFFPKPPIDTNQICPTQTPPILASSQPLSSWGDSSALSQLLQ